MEVVFTEGDNVDKVEATLDLGVVVDDNGELVALCHDHDENVVGFSSFFAPSDGIRGVDPRRGDGTVNCL